MKDGSVTFPLGSVDVREGARCRFFVRDGDFAKKEGEPAFFAPLPRAPRAALSGRVARV